MYFVMPDLIGWILYIL